MNLSRFKLHKFISLVSLLSTLLLFPNSFFTQDETIKIDTDLVTVPATIYDRQGRFVTDLEKDNFEIYENGFKQNISYFQRTDHPVTVFLLLDVSVSMKDNIPNLINSVNVFLNQLHPDNQVLIASFCNNIRRLQKKVLVKKVKKDKIKKLKYCGKSTILYKAVDFSFDKLRKTSGRKALILFSDGIDSGLPSDPNQPTLFSNDIGFGTPSSIRIQAVNADDNFRDAEELDALIYTIQFEYIRIGKSGKVILDKEFEDYYMNKLADLSGGRNFKVENLDNMAETFEKVAKEIGQQYYLGYYPNNPGKKGERREIKVKVNIPNVAVRSRTSYIVGSNKD